MDCRHRAGFTCRLSRLKLTASKKMGGLIKNNEDLFFLFMILSVENRISEDAYTFIFLFAKPIFLVITGHLRT